MRLVWKWCEFKPYGFIIWIKTRKYYKQYIFRWKMEWHNTHYTEETMPYIINIGGL